MNKPKWNDWATYETVDSNGRVVQHEYEPDYLEHVGIWLSGIGQRVVIGVTDKPQDANNAIVYRYSDKVNKQPKRGNENATVTTGDNICIIYVGDDTIELSNEG